ncbi:sodium:solute symporter family transporter [Allorhodopirellula heiligendammensis]|uniref:Sodium/glucose cotransporter n=1 Tax=Allorhodopirellula heiligendammensis TaxID=2714739 RepID=A0A5C6BTG3_9BACT|nr:sodium/solute symporter [Allorhodopirellula heiligendammensis]TWU15132.1 Sodium/glucose cotransporter [Allorhodopirellula heiligendammensis]
MNILEVVLFLGSVIGVIALGIWMAKEPDDGDPSDDASDYFLAGRGLTWWLVGFSLIAANISTEQFVGMSGSAANWLGMAIASYEWMAAVTLVLVGFFFLPRFLKAGLFTIPEFLEYRFDWIARLVMAIPAVVTLVFVATSSVIYSGAKFISEYYHQVPVLNNLTAMCWLIAMFAAAYVFVGGLKACAWTDLVWGSALILGGVIVMVMAFVQLSERPADDLIKTKVANSNATVEDLENAGFWRRFILLNDGVDNEAVAVNGENGSGGKTHMVRPKEDSDIPWTALLVGLWIPNFFYWGLNQYIVQRTLGSKSLAEGQKGIVFAASMKLIIPFLVVIPGIMAFNLFSGDLHQSASQRNINTVETAGASTVFTVDNSFVELQPDLAWQALQQNAGLAGESLDVTPTDPPEKIGDQINDYAKIAVVKNAELQQANKLVGYDYDSAFPVLVRNLIKPYPMISWFILAALSGAVISSLASMLNSASTLATMDLYAKVTKETNQQRLVVVGRVFVVLFVLLSATVAPYLDSFESIFKFIQEFQGFISPGILAVFLLGFFSPRTPRYFGWLGILINVIAYGALMLFLGDWIVQGGWWYGDQIAFLDRMAICFFTVLLTGAIVTLANPLKTPVKMPVNEAMNMTSSRGAQIAGVGVILVTACMYYYFW